MSRNNKQNMYNSYNNKRYDKYDNYENTKNYMYNSIYNKTKNRKYTNSYSQKEYEEIKIIIAENNCSYKAAETYYKDSFYKKNLNIQDYISYYPIVYMINYEDIFSYDKRKAKENLVVKMVSYDNSQEFIDTIDHFNSFLINMKIVIVNQPCTTPSELSILLIQLEKYDKLYCFGDVKSLITEENVISIASAINDLKLSIFQIKNKEDFKKENLEAAYKSKMKQIERINSSVKNSIQQKISDYENNEVNRTDDINTQSVPSKDDLNDRIPIEETNKMDAAVAKDQSLFEKANATDPSEPDWDSLSNHDKLILIEKNGIDKYSKKTFTQELILDGMERFKKYGNEAYKIKDYNKAKDWYQLGYSFFSLNPSKDVHETSGFPKMILLMFQLHNNYIQCSMAHNDWNDAYRVCKTILNFVEEGYNPGYTGTVQSMKKYLNKEQIQKLYHRTVVVCKNLNYLEEMKIALAKGIEYSDQEGLSKNDFVKLQIEYQKLYQEEKKNSKKVYENMFNKEQAMANSVNSEYTNKYDSAMSKSSASGDEEVEGKVGAKADDDTSVYIGLGVIGLGVIAIGGYFLMKKYM